MKLMLSMISLKKMSDLIFGKESDQKLLSGDLKVAIFEIDFGILIF